MINKSKGSLYYTIIGGIGSLALTIFFNSFPQYRIMSNEACVFGVMSVVMSIALKNKK